ncbi:hypothetical protein PROFUN_11137 [Planoprotostelium fungivorum]|uniref:Uncharacterized protein n=1 Tax=Planoprotostelium fungivorum TaxID=1890364 RepID=A0A2P6NAU4_9EUKA|nr:hypothetical protein PROFUN_11137 [Planoprotostelium fungivorum]
MVNIYTPMMCAVIGMLGAGIGWITTGIAAFAPTAFGRSLCTIEGYFLHIDSLIRIRTAGLCLRAWEWNSKVTGLGGDILSNLINRSAFIVSQFDRIWRLGSLVNGTYQCMVPISTSTAEWSDVNQHYRITYLFNQTNYLASRSLYQKRFLKACLFFAGIMITCFSYWIVIVLHLAATHHLRENILKIYGGSVKGDQREVELITRG